MELPPLDPSQNYTIEQLRPYSFSDKRNWGRAREELLTDAKRKTREAGGMDVTMESDLDLPAPMYKFPAGPYPLAEMKPSELQTYERPIGPAIPSYLIKKARREGSNIGRGLQLVGDKKNLVAGYKENSLCNTLVGDAVDRAFLAMRLLDRKHADIIETRLKKAGIKNANASHAGSKEITFKKAVSIALQAERWVYEAQAAAAKSMVKESGRCLHNLAGRRKRTVEEKEQAYEKRYGKPRLDRSGRAKRRLAERIAVLDSK